MEMEMEAGAELQPEALIQRLVSAAEALEAATERLANVELQAAATRESDLATRLAAAESTIATLRAGNGRKTANPLTAKEGSAGMSHELQASAIDTALSTLSLEQRIAVKAQLLRSGLIG